MAYISVPCFATVVHRTDSIFFVVTLVLDILAMRRNRAARGTGATPAASAAPAPEKPAGGHAQPQYDAAQSATVPQHSTAQDKNGGATAHGADVERDVMGNPVGPMA